MVPVESVHSEEMPFGGHTHHQVSRISKGNPQTHEKFRVPKVISPILSNVEKFADFNGSIVF